MCAARYRVRLARPVFQVVTVEVEAEDRHQAVVKALMHAGGIPEDDWTGAFDPENYFYDPQYVQEVEESELYNDDPDVYDRSVDRYTNYLLLKADTFSGEGYLMYQPWLSDISPHMVDDLCSDWTAELEKTRGGGASGYFERVRKEAEDARRKPAKVIPIKRPPPKK